MHSLRTTFKYVDMDILDFITTLKEISGILNSRPVELLLGSYRRDGGGQEYESHLPDSWTAITPQDLLIGDGSVGNERLSYREPGPRRIEKLSQKIKQWHATWVEGCQERLFICDPRWAKKTRNLVPGDIVWLIKESKLSTTLKWGLVTHVYPDQEGVVRDVMLRYALLKPNTEPYIAPYTRKGPFKEKLVAVQNLSMFYSAEEQAFDKNRLMGQTEGENSTEVNMEKNFPENDGSPHPLAANKQVTWSRSEQQGSASNLCSGTRDGITDLFDDNAVRSEANNITNVPEGTCKDIVIDREKVLIKHDGIHDTAGEIVDRNLWSQQFREGCKSRGMSCNDEPIEPIVQTAKETSEDL